MLFQTRQLKSYRKFHFICTLRLLISSSHLAIISSSSSFSLLLTPTWITVSPVSSFRRFSKTWVTSMSNIFSSFCIQSENEANLLSRSSGYISMWVFALQTSLLTYKTCVYRKSAALIKTFFNKGRANCKLNEKLPIWSKTFSIFNFSATKTALNCS